MMHQRNAKAAANDNKGATKSAVREDFLKNRNVFSPLSHKNGVSTEEEDEEEVEEEVEDPDEPVCSLFTRSPLDSAVEATEDSTENGKKRPLSSDSPKDKVLRRVKSKSVSQQ